MKKNVGCVDRVIRFVLALGIVALILAGVLQGTIAIILGIVAGILVITGAIRFCPLWVLLGINTAGHNKGDSKGSCPNCR